METRNVAVRAGRWSARHLPTWLRRRPDIGEPVRTQLLGDANWYLPKWLEWLPHVAHEESADAAPDPKSDLGVSIARGGERVRITLAGELDLRTCPALTRRLEEVEADTPETIEIDLRRLEFLDSTGLGVLFAANRRAREAGRRLVLLKGEGPIDRILEIAHVEDVIDTVEEPSAG